MRKYGPLAGTNRVANYQALAVVMLVLEGHRRRIDNQKIIEATKVIWPKIGHHTSSDYIDLLVNTLCYTHRDCFVKFTHPHNKQTIKRKLTPFGVVEAHKALDVLNPKLIGVNV